MKEITKNFVELAPLGPFHSATLRYKGQGVLLHQCAIVKVYADPDRKRSRLLTDFL